MEKINVHFVITTLLEMLLLKSTFALTNTKIYKVNQANTPITKLTLNHNNGDIFVGAKNSLLQFDNELTLKNSQTIGPVLDDFNGDCLPSPEPCDKTRTLNDNVVKLLLVNSNEKFLLMCGSVWQGLCSSHPLDDITTNTTLAKNHVPNFIGGTNTTVTAVFRTSTNQIFTAVNLNNRLPRFQPPLISTRTYSSNPWTFNYVSENANSHSYIDVDAQVRRTFYSYYLDSFIHGRYVYFLSVQSQDPYGLETTNNKFVTKIIQVCLDDTTYASYTEFPLQCEHEGTTYDIAVDSYFSPVQPNLEKLYVTFGKSLNYSPNVVKTRGSVMCFYPFDEIESKFMELQRRCYEQGEGYKPLWVYGRGIQQPRLCQKAVAQYDEFSYCGAQTNIGIQDKEPTDVLRTYATTYVDDTILTSIVVMTQGQTPVAVMGTQEGELVKTLVDPDNKLMAPYLVYNISQGQAILRDMVIARDERTLYLATDQHVIKFPLDLCEVYSTCEECVTSGDPLGCGWCKGTCTQSTSGCIPWSDDTCPPVILDVEPKSGPKAGGTRVTLTGKNFGHTNGLQSVKIGTGYCVVQFANYTHLECFSFKSNEDGQFPFILQVTDTTKTGIGYNINGTFSEEDVKFQFKEPKLEGYSPEIGPVSGGTNVTITGSDLDIGEIRSVMIANIQAEIVSVMPTEIVCTTGPWSLASAGATAEGPLQLSIDRGVYWVYTDYAYTVDSSIDTVTPQRSLESGGIDLTVTGRNLQIIQEPRIGVTVQNKKSSLLLCSDISSDGRTMKCPSPNISGLIESKIDNTTPEDGRLWFVMDGITALTDTMATDQQWRSFRYYPDPKFYKFTEIDHTKKINIEETSLEIKGEKIGLGIRNVDLTIRIGNDGGCLVKELRATFLFCELINKPTQGSSDELPVVVSVGQLSMEVGYVMFTETPKSASLASIILIVAIVMVVVGIIVIVFIMWRKKIGPFKKKVNKEFRAAYMSGRAVNTSPGGEHMYDMMDNQRNERISESMNEEGSMPVFDDDLLEVLEDKHLLIDSNNLFIGEELGRGHFGSVFKSFIRNPESQEDTLVAVKTLHLDSPRDIDVQSFIDEALRMKDFNNKNVLTLTGICFGKDAMPLVILPYMKHGDLLSYIRNDKNNPTIKDLIIFGIDIAHGMEYLASLKFVHRDLAARNCMLDEVFSAKVADFGLSRDIYERDYYSSDNKKSKLPVKWMAPECLEKGNYNSKSDVWSFGIVLWELMTRGVNPYPEVDNWDVLRYIKAGRRMPQPPYCPDALYHMMMKCWKFNPNDRPTFTEAAEEIRDMIKVLEQQMKQGQQRSNIDSTYVNVDMCTDYHYGDIPESAASVACGDSASGAATPATNIVVNELRKSRNMDEITEV